MILPFCFVVGTATLVAQAMKKFDSLNVNVVLHEVVFAFVCKNRQIARTDQYNH